MKKLVFLISLLFVFSSCSSSEEEELLLRQKLSQLTSNEDMFWQKLPNQLTEQPAECVYKFFQNGYIYSERCVRLWNQSLTNEFCTQDWYNGFQLNKATIVSETETKLVFVYDDKTYEVNYNEPVVSIKANAGNFNIVTSKITDSKVDDYLEWITYTKCN